MIARLEACQVHIQHAVVLRGSRGEGQHLEQPNSLKERHRDTHIVHHTVAHNGARCRLPPTRVRALRIARSPTIEDNR